MMNDNDHRAVEALASAWDVETKDIAARVASAIGATTNPPSEMAELLAELRAMRQEMHDLRRAVAVLQDEVFRLRMDQSQRSAPRIAPYSPTEGLVRLS
jgi:hypothetical protein